MKELDCVGYGVYVCILLEVNSPLHQYADPLLQRRLCSFHINLIILRQNDYEPIENPTIEN